MSGLTKTPEEVAVMFAAYCEKQSARHVARTCQVAPATARRYINEGDPDRGIEPFALRFKRVNQQTARRVERKFVYTSAASTAATQHQLHKLDQLIDKAAEKLMTRLDDPDHELKLGDLAKAMAVRATILEKLSPQITESAEAKQQAEFAGRSAVELDFYATYGRWPNEREVDAIETITPPPLALESRDEARSEQDPETPEEHGAEPLDDPEADPVQVPPDTSGPDAHTESAPTPPPESAPVSDSASPGEAGSSALPPVDVPDVPQVDSFTDSQDSSPAHLNDDSPEELPVGLSACGGTENVSRSPEPAAPPAEDQTGDQDRDREEDKARRREEYRPRDTFTAFLAKKGIDL